MKIELDIGTGERKIPGMYGIRTDLGITAVSFGLTNQDLGEFISDCVGEGGHLSKSPENAVTLLFHTAESLQKHIDVLQKYLDWQIKDEAWQKEYCNFDVENEI